MDVFGTKPTQPTDIGWLNTPASPVVLAQLFKQQLPLIYQMRKNGQLPVNAEASYSECISTYIGYLHRRATTKNVEGQEELTAAQVKNLQSRTHLNWLEIAEKKQELVDIDKVSLMLEAAFLRMRDTVTNLGRKYPDAESELLRAFADLADYGEQVKTKNAAAFDDLIAKELQE